MTEAFRKTEHGAASSEGYTVEFTAGPGIVYEDRDQRLRIDSEYLLREPLTVALYKRTTRTNLSRAEIDRVFDRCARAIAFLGYGVEMTGWDEYPSN